MKTARTAASMTLVILLAGCGGGGSDGPPPLVVLPTPAPTPAPPPPAPTPPPAPAPTPPAPTPTATGVTMSPQSQTATVSDDDAGSIGFDAFVTGNSSDPVYAHVQYDNQHIAPATTLKRDSENRYRVRFRPANDLPFGAHAGTITFRLCRDTGCNVVVDGTTKTFPYSMTLRLGDWTTFQRNAGHTGYVRQSYDPATFARVWEVVPEGTESMSDIASRDDLVYMTTRNVDRTSTIHAFASATGQRRWLYSLGSVHSAGPPAVGNGRVFVSTMTSSSNTNPIQSIMAANGAYGGATYPFASQWSNFLAPTTFDTGLYMSAGYYGGVAFGFDTANVMPAWIGNATRGGVSELTTPAVDATSVYYYAGATLAVFDRFTGTLVRSIEDPFYQAAGHLSFGAAFGGPILGSRANVMSFSGNRTSDVASVLVNWSIDQGAVLWRSGDAYSTSPAIGEGRIYMARNRPSRLDALSEADGSVSWSWTPPPGETFMGNTVLTRNLVFVSTNRAVYALPVQGDDHRPVWSAPDPGRMILTANGMLVIVKGVPAAVYEGASPSLGYKPTALVGYRVR